MLRLPKIIRKTLSVRISLMVVTAMAMLLMASLVVMLFYARQAVKDEAIQRARQTLDVTMQRIDNILLSVEQTAGNMYFDMMTYMAQPDMVDTFCLKTVETNPYVVGCAIAMKENYYSDSQWFMAYYRRNSHTSLIERAESFGHSHYSTQQWFLRPMESFVPEWMDPMNDVSGEGIEPIITFCLPLPGSDGLPAGVIGVDVSRNHLSRIISEAKPSANSYCTLLDRNGSFIVHTDTTRLMRQKALEMSAVSVRQAAQAMVKGETGYRAFQLNGREYYVFFKPFRRAAVQGRAMKELGWSAGIIYPEDDIFGDYNSLIWYVLAIAFTGLLLLFFLSRMVTHRQLKPLLMLTEKAQRIAKGNYNEPIPDSQQDDEIGRLQDNFQQMQRSLAVNIGELEQLTAQLGERGEVLREAYNEAQKADRMKMAFLHNMTNQMLEPAAAIHHDVSALCDRGSGDTTATTSILQNGNTIAELLKNLINMSDEEGKEVTDV